MRCGKDGMRGEWGRIGWRQTESEEARILNVYQIPFLRVIFVNTYTH